VHSIALLFPGIRQYIIAIFILVFHSPPTISHTPKTSQLYPNFPLPQLPTMSSINRSTTTTRVPSFVSMQIMHEIDAACAYKPPRRHTKVNCPYCNLEFSSQGNLNRHHRTAHLRQRVFCDVSGCNQSFSQSADLKRHKKRLHPSQSSHSHSSHSSHSHGSGSSGGSRSHTSRTQSSLRKKQ